MTINEALQSLLEDEQLVCRPINWVANAIHFNNTSRKFEIIGLQEREWPDTIEELFNEWEVLLFEEFLNEQNSMREIKDSFVALVFNTKKLKNTG